MIVLFHVTREKATRFRLLPGEEEKKGIKNSWIGNWKSVYIIFPFCQSALAISSSCSRHTVEFRCNVHLLFPADNAKENINLQLKQVLFFPFFFFLMPLGCIFMLRKWKWQPIKWETMTERWWKAGNKSLDSIQVESLLSLGVIIHWNNICNSRFVLERKSYENSYFLRDSRFSIFS